jgi:hypothetical protein
MGKGQFKPRASSSLSAIIGRGGIPGLSTF